MLKLVKHDYPDRPVLILSMHPEAQFAIRALRGGAAGYITKESAPEELIAAIRKITTGGKYVSNTLAGYLIEEFAPPVEQPLHASLSDREYEILRLLAKGKTTPEIAAQLFLSTKTIHTHRSHILEKLHLRNTAELIRYAVEHKLVEYDDQ